MTKVKICGLSTTEAVETAVSAGADYIGFVFAPSKRQVTLDQAAELAKLIPADVKKVGVFVSPSRAELLEVIEKLVWTWFKFTVRWQMIYLRICLVPVFRLCRWMERVMCPILRQTIYSLMPLWQGVARPLIGVNWIRLD